MSGLWECCVSGAVSLWESRNARFWENVRLWKLGNVRALKSHPTGNLGTSGCQNSGNAGTPEIWEWQDSGNVTAGLAPAPAGSALPGAVPGVPGRCRPGTIPARILGMDPSPPGAAPAACPAPRSRHPRRRNPRQRNPLEWRESTTIRSRSWESRPNPTPALPNIPRVIPARLWMFPGIQGQPRFLWEFQPRISKC